MTDVDYPAFLGKVGPLTCYHSNCVDKGVIDKPLTA